MSLYHISIHALLHLTERVVHSPGAMYVCVVLHGLTMYSVLCSFSVATAPPPVGGAAPGQSTLSRDIEELQEIVARLATTRSRPRLQAPRGVMTGMSPVSASCRQAYLHTFVHTMHARHSSTEELANT